MAHTYTMTANILARLMTPNLKDRLTPKPNSYLRLADGKGHDVGIIVHDSSPEEILPFLISALKTAGYQGSWRTEDPSLTTQFLALLKSFESKPNKPSCHTCGKDLLVGQEITSVGRRGKGRQYHSLCYESTFH